MSPWVMAGLGRVKARTKSCLSVCLALLHLESLIICALVRMKQVLLPWAHLKGARDLIVVCPVVIWIVKLPSWRGAMWVGSRRGWGEQ